MWPGNSTSSPVSFEYESPLQSPAELVDDAAYSQVSPAAVVALVLGLASPLAFVAPLFFLVPAAAVGTALLALGKIRRSGGTATGQLLARTAIALGLACAAAAIVRGSVRDSLMQSQAVATAQRWFGMLADGRVADALALLTGEAHASLVPRPEMGQPPIAAEEAETIALDRLRSDPLARALAGGSQPATLETAAGPVFDGPKAVVSATFVVVGADGQQHRHVQVTLARARYYESEGEPWRIERWDAGTAHAAH